MTLFNPEGIDKSSGQQRLAISGDVIVDSAGNLLLAGGVELLSITASVDAKATGTTALFTVPTGTQVIITQVAYRVTAADTVTVAPTIGVGIAGGEDDIIFPEALTGIAAVGDVFISTNSAKSVFGDSGDVISIGIDIGATATTLTLEVNLIGFVVGAQSAGTITTGGGGSAASLNTIRFVVGADATTDSTAVLPASARVVYTNFQVTSVYSPGTTIAVGTTASSGAFLASSATNPFVLGSDINFHDTDGASSVVRVTITNTPGAGAGVCMVWYTNPDT